MALHKLARRNYGGKLSVSIKYQNLHSFKEGMILVCQSILETRRISHLHGSALFSIPLRGAWRKRGGVMFLRGVDTPMHTMSVGGGTEQDRENTRFQGCTRPHSRIRDRTSVDRHGERTPKIISFMKACDGHTHLMNQRI